MSIASVASLVDLLRDSQLLDAAQLEQVERDLATQPDDPRGLANLLVLRGWLTNYQVEQIFLGQTQELVLGPYRLVELLGQGGMGQVFKALHTRLNRIVALKIIRQERLSKDSEAVKRFHREAQAAGSTTYEPRAAQGPRWWAVPLVVPAVLAVTALARWLDRLDPHHEDTLGWLLVARRPA